MDQQVVVVGAGHAGVQVATSLRDRGWSGSIRLVGTEPYAPCERPPLSKALLGAEDDYLVPLRSPDHYRSRGIDLLTGVDVTRLDRARRQLHTAGGDTLHYDHLVLATGAVPRRVPVPGCDLDGVHVLRSADHARALRAALLACRRLVVVGAGFIGLEVAAAAAAGGIDVRVVEMAERVMQRSVSAEMSAYFERHHRRTGVALHLGRRLVEITGARGRVTGVVTSAGEDLPADVVLVGAGVTPACDLARDAGLAVTDGVVVDEQLVTNDPAVSAVGDCAAFPGPDGCLVRLESVQNAADQARHVAARLTGDPSPYRAVPWFWSVQGERKLQIAGLGSGVDATVERGDPDGRYAVFGFRAGTLVTVESVDDPASHIWGRKLLESGATLDAGRFAATGFDFRAAAREAVAAGVGAP